MKKCVEISGIYHCHSFFFRAHTFVNKIAGYLQSSLSGPLAVSCLKHIELAVLNGKFHVLHISVMILKSLADILKLGKCLREFFFHFGNLHRRPYTCNHIFTLRIGEELAKKSLITCRRIPCESNTGTTVITHITESH